MSRVKVVVAHYRTVTAQCLWVRSIWWRLSFPGETNKTQTNIRTNHYPIFINQYMYMFCLFGVYHPTREFYTNIETSANFDLRWTLMLFSVPHLLWHGTSVYNSHLRGPVTLSPITERLAVELSLSVFTTVAAGNQTPNLPLAGLTPWPTAPPPRFTCICIQAQNMHQWKSAETIPAKFEITVNK